MSAANQKIVMKTTIAAITAVNLLTTYMLLFG